MQRLADRAACARRCRGGRRRRGEDAGGAHVAHTRRRSRCTAVGDDGHLELEALLALRLRRRGAEVEGERRRGLGQRLDDAPLEGLVHVDRRATGDQKRLSIGSIGSAAPVGRDVDAHRPDARGRGEDASASLRHSSFLRLLIASTRPSRAASGVDVVAEHEVGLRVQLVVHAQLVEALVQHGEVLAARATSWSLTSCTVSRCARSSRMRRAARVRPAPRRPRRPAARRARRRRRPA